MALSVNNNSAALNTYRNLTSTQSSLGKSLEKLSSGYRINRAADDAAGLAISEGLRSQINGLTQASRNAQDGINVVQTAEGAMSEVTTILQRMRTLAVQSANDSNGADARTAITSEVSQLQTELTRIATSTKFGQTPLLDGTQGNLTFQVGATGANADKISIDLTTPGLNISGVASALSTSAGASYNVNVGNIASGELLKVTQASGNTVAVAITTSGTTTLGDVVGQLNANSQFKQDFVARIDDKGKLEVMAKTGSGAVTIAQRNAGDTAAGAAVALSNLSTISGAIDLSSSSGSRTALAAIDSQIASVSLGRATLGAYQNRFEHTINNLNVTVENLTASESSIRDTDMAAEMTKFTSRQILAQAGTAMLSQAKNLPQSVLSLLQG